MVHAFQFSSRHVYLPRNGLSPSSLGTEKNGFTISSSAGYQGTSSPVRDLPTSPHERATALPPTAGSGEWGEGGGEEGNTGLYFASRCE